MTDVIKLNLINNSNEIPNGEIVICQKLYSEQPAVAWQVIKNLGIGSSHPFTYSWALEVSAMDPEGNYTPKLPAHEGQAFDLILQSTGNTLVPSAQPATTPKATEINNLLPQGAINANIYRDGKLLATKTQIPPQQKAVFQFKPTIWIGVASQVEAGQIMDSAIISNINTELSLLGIASANIIMTGGGPGGQPYHFSLANVVNY
jgi:hypothetical protein